MKENKRNILVVMISMIAAMLLFMSCKEDGDYMTCTYPTYNSTIGSFEKESDEAYYIDSDKGNKFYVANYGDMLDKGYKPGQRVYAEFNTPVGERPYVGQITVVRTYPVSVKEVSALDESMGDDPITVVNLWNSKNFLNVQYMFASSSTYVHSLDLVAVPSPKKSKPGYQYLELRHSLNGDTPVTNIVGIISFDISRYLSDSNLKGFIIKVNDRLAGDTFVRYDIDK